MPGTSQARPVEETTPFATFNTIPSPGLFDKLDLSTPSDDVTSDQLALHASERGDAGMAQTQMLDGDMREKTNAISLSSYTLHRMQGASSDMNLAVGGTLVPAPLEEFPGTARRQVPRAGPGLRLPSFEMLGIAAPRPDQLNNSHQITSLDGRLNYLANNASHDCKTSPLLTGKAPVTLTGNVIRPALPDTDAMAVSKCALQSPICHDIDVLTPPADSGDVPWNIPSVVVMSGPIDSPGTNPDLHLGILSHDDEPDQPTHASTAYLGSDIDAIDQSGSRPGEASIFHAAPAWVRPAVHKLLQQVQNASGPIDETLKVLSHALPSPSQNGHIFSLIINDLHLALPSGRTEWINVLHAIPGEYNLERLPPTSPPATPGPAIGGEDYFTKKAFDTAVTILDYQSDLSIQMPSPNRAVASPSSIHVAIVERYIPPTNVNEFSEMFNPDGPSILVDRLVELSPDNGTLLFIYPNKAGAQSFYAEYLEPIKAPTLRALATRYNVPISVGEPLENLDKTLLSQLPTHAQLATSLQDLCARLTATSTSLRNFRHRSSRFKCVHAQTASVAVPLAVWLSDWWSKQEKRKLRTAMQDFAQAASNQRSDPYLGTPPSENVLVQQLLHDMARKADRVGLTSATVEVSIFVVTRSA